MNADHLKAENRALRTCLQALLQAREWPGAQTIVYNTIEAGFGPWEGVPPEDLREAAVLLRAVRGSRETGSMPPAPVWSDVVPALTLEVQAETAARIAAWVKAQPSDPGLRGNELLATEIREGAWK